MSAEETWPPRIAGPDTSLVTAVLEHAGIAAWTGGYTVLDTARNVQSGAGVWVMVHGLNMETRDRAVDALLESGYVLNDAGATIDVRLEPDEWGAAVA